MEAPASHGSSLGYLSFHPFDFDDPCSRGDDFSFFFLPFSKDEFGKRRDSNRLRFSLNLFLNYYVTLRRYIYNVFVQFCWFCNFSCNFVWRSFKNFSIIDMVNWFLRMEIWTKWMKLEGKETECGFCFFHLLILDSVYICRKIPRYNGDARRITSPSMRKMKTDGIEFLS